MAFARGSQRGLRYVEESVFATLPASPTMVELRTTGDSLSLSRQQNESAELRSDRQTADVRMGNASAGGDIQIEFSYGSFDDLLQALIMGTWATPYNETGVTIDVDGAANTFTRSTGSFVTDGVKVGDHITFGGFAESGNNGTFEVTDVTATVVTCANATGLVTESGGGDETFTTSGERISTGTNLRTFSIEKAHTDIDQYQLFTGCGINSMSLSISPNQMVTGSFSVMGSDMSLSQSTNANSVTDAPTSSPFDSFTGSIKEGGSTIAIVTDLSLSIENGLSQNYVVFTDGAVSLTDGRSRVTGSISVYFEDETLLEKFVNETESDLVFTLTDTDGNGYRFILPRIKYTGAPTPVSGEDNIILNMPFMALYDSTEGTNLILDKIPAIS